MPGPAPDPNARRRNKKRVDFVLPRGGRKGRTPPWPIADQSVPATWASLWRTPQAAAWDELGIHRTVARYAMLLLKAEKPDCPAALLGEVRQMEDRLGLSPVSMLRLSWALSDDEVSSRGASTGEPKTAPARARLKIVG